jgi:hypothetical protein
MKKLVVVGVIYEVVIALVMVTIFVLKFMGKLSLDFYSFAPLAFALIWGGSLFPRASKIQPEEKGYKLYLSLLAIYIIVGTLSLIATAILVLRAFGKM